MAGNDADIARIASSGEQRRKGIGSLLFESLKQICKERNINKIMLDVREHNSAARSFYKKCGFTVDGIRKGFYENPKEDAVLMSCSLAEPAFTGEQ